MNKTLVGQDNGFKTNGPVNKNLRYANDMVLIAETLQDLQTYVDVVVAVSEEYRLRPETWKIYTKKSSK